MKRFLATAVCLFLGVSASAATKSWTGAVNNLWSVGGNWSGGVAPVSGDALEFPSGAPQTTIVNDLSGLTIDTITFTSFFVGPPYHVSGNAITLTNGMTGSPPFTWTVPTTLGGSQTFDSINGTFGSVDLNGHTLTLNSATVGGSIAGNGDVSFTGASAHLTGSINITGSVQSGPFSFCQIDIDGSITATQLNIDGMPVAPPSLTGSGTLPSTILTNTLFTPDDTVVAGNLVANASSFRYFLTPTTANKATVNGSVTLNNPELWYFFPGAQPAAGTSFVILENDGADAVSGTFNGLPEGAVFGHSGVQLQITYAGGTGNDVVLTVIEAEKSWTGSVNGLWSVGGNWIGGVAPVDGDALRFPSGASFTTNTNDILGLSLESIALPSGAPDYAISGNAVTLMNGITTDLISGSLTWNVPTTLGASQTFYGTLARPNTIDLNGHTLTINAEATLTGSITGTGDLVLGGLIGSTGPINISGDISMNMGTRWNAVGTITASHLDANAAPGGFPSVLAGTATFPPTTLNFTWIQPGDSPGTFCCIDPHVIGTLTTGSLIVNSNSRMFYDLTVPSSDRVAVNGTVTLHNADLVLTFLAGDPPLGTSFVLIENDGTDPVSGTFLNYTEGSVFTQGSLLLRITYAGGTGNDVVLTVVTPTTTVLESSTATTVTGESFVLTATVSSSSGTPTGEVRFERGSVVLGSAMLNASGQAVLTATAQVGTDPVVAIYTGEGIFAPSQSAPLAHTTALASTTVEVTTEPNPSYPHAGAVIVVEVSPVAPATGVPSGNVTVSVDGVFVATLTLDDQGRATIPLPRTSYGMHTIRAEYAGDSNYLESSDESQHETAHAEIPTLNSWMLMLLAAAMAIAGMRLTLR